MNENRDSIMRMARGAFEERVDYEMDKVIQNILDPNTKATAKRKITLTIELTPDDERRQIQVSVTAKSTLAATNPVATSLYVTGDSNGELVVAEMVPQVPGQMNMDGTQQEAPKLLNSMIPDDDPGVLVPHEVGDGGLLLMPTRAHIPDPQRDDWKPATCPICGAECWETEIHRQVLAAEPGLRAVCTDCGLRGAAGVGLVDTSSKKEEKDHE